MTKGSLTPDIRFSCVVMVEPKIPQDQFCTGDNAVEAYSSGSSVEAAVAADGSPKGGRIQISS